MTMLEDQQALQLVLENLSMAIGPSGALRATKTPLQSSTGMFYNVTERNGAYKDPGLAKFDLKKPSPSSVVNVTEHVYVPSSEHVAEIVGRQGCKIKALRNKTNTYIKTPGRGEEPLFIITGQRDDVAIAVNEIKQASAHFTNIRAQRNKGLSPPAMEGQVTDRVQVPYRVVGLVVGPKGQTIKQIQTKTSTYIVTPSRERDPIFEITGLPENVAKAREEIITYITARTGMSLEENAIGELTFNGSANGGGGSGPMGKTPTGVWNPSKQDIDEFDNVSEVLSNTMAGIYGENAVASSVGLSRQFGSKSLMSVASLQPAKVKKTELAAGVFGDENRDPIQTAFSSAASAERFMSSPMRGLNVNTYNPFIWDNSALLQQQQQQHKSGLRDLLSSPGERDPLTQFRFGVGADHTSEFSSAVFGLNNDAAKVSPLSSNDGSQHSTSDSCSSLPLSSNVLQLPATNTTETNPIAQFGVFLPGFFGGETNNNLITATASDPIGSDTWLLTPPRPMKTVELARDKCRLCSAESINAALVPCGHNHFCYSCAKDYVGVPCPSCNEVAKNVLRIFK